MNTDICKLYSSGIYWFSERKLYTQTEPSSHLLSGCHSHVVLGTKDKIRYDAKYSSRVCEMKSMTCSVMPVLKETASER